MNSNQIKKIDARVICVWFGDWPAYLPIFLTTAGHCTALNWLIISDNTSLPYETNNVTLMTLQAKDFEKVASERLGFSIKIRVPYKLCDFKPCYGDIFRDYIEDFDYWGHCDLDLVIGDLDRILKPALDKKPDILSLYSGYISGPLCLYMNSEKVRTLYKDIVNRKSGLQNPEHLALDENHKAGFGTLNKANLWYSRVIYLIVSMLNGNVFRMSRAESRYRFQWYLKRKYSKSLPARDLSEVIYKRSGSGNLSAIYLDCILSDRYFGRQGVEDWEIRWKNGQLMQHGKELYCFHFPDLSTRIKIPANADIGNGFKLNNRGFTN